MTPESDPMSTPDQPNQPTEDKPFEWREDLSTDMRSPLGFLPVWGWIVLIVVIAVIGAIAFGALFMGKTETREGGHGVSSSLTTTAPEATTTSKYGKNVSGSQYDAPPPVYVEPSPVETYETPDEESTSSTTPTETSKPTPTPTEPEPGTKPDDQTQPTNTSAPDTTPEPGGDTGGDSTGEKEESTGG